MVNRSKKTENNNVKSKRKLKGGNPLTDGSLCREINTLRGHSDGITSVVFDPTGRFLATGSRDKTAKLWHLRPNGTVDQSNVSSIAGHTWSVNSIAFHPSGNFLATGSGDKTTKVWRVSPDGSDVSHVSTLAGHRYSVVSVAFHPNGELLATASTDNTVKLWRVKSDGLSDDTPVSTLMGHIDNSVAFDPIGRFLATGSSDTIARLWNVLAEGVTASPILTLSDHVEEVLSVAFHPNDYVLATGSNDTTVKLWRYSSDGAAATCVSTLTGHTEEVTSVSFHPSGHFLATGSGDNTIKLWRLQPDGSTPICIETLTGHSRRITSVAFHPSGNLLATGSWDKTLKLWNCSKINELLRREAITRAGLATHLLKGLTTQGSKQQLQFSNSAQGRLANPPDMPYTLENRKKRAEIVGKKYVGLLSRKPISSKPDDDFTQCDRCKADDAAAADLAATNPEFMAVFHQRSKSHCIDCPREENRKDTDKMPGGRRSRRKGYLHNK